MLTPIDLSAIMGTEFKHADLNMEDSGNSCGSSVVSDYSGPSYSDLDGVQISDLENLENEETDVDSHVLQVGIKFLPVGLKGLAQWVCFDIYYLELLAKIFYKICFKILLIEKQVYFAKNTTFSSQDLYSLDIAI